MNKPERLILSDGESIFGFGRSGAYAGIGIIVLVAVISLTQPHTDTTLADYVLPVAALALFWGAWIGLHAFVGLIHYLGTKRDVNRLFANDIWQQWQYRSDEWQSVVEAEYQKMCPESGIGVYRGAVYSTIVGLVVSIILIAVGKFAIKDEQAMPIIFFCAGAVTMLFAGVGLLQPIQERREARRYRRNALRVPAPRIWFGAEGIYHESLGYTSLKKLRDVKNHTRSRQTVVFTIEVTFGMGGDSPESKQDVPVTFLVPSGYEQQAAQLVRRYRQERLRG
jgi:hypothetical protein